MLKYYKLFNLLNRRDMKKTDLLDVISSPTLAKISKGEEIKTGTIEKICEFLKCQPGDIMENISDQTEEDEIGYTTEIKYMLNEFDEPINITDCRITNDEKNKKFIQDIIDSQNNKAPISKSNKKQ